MKSLHLSSLLRSFFILILILSTLEESKGETYYHFFDEKSISLKDDDSPIGKIDHSFYKNLEKSVEGTQILWECDKLSITYPLIPSQKSDHHKIVFSTNRLKEKPIRTNNSMMGTFDLDFELASGTMPSLDTDIDSDLTNESVQVLGTGANTQSIVIPPFGLPAGSGYLATGWDANNGNNFFMMGSVDQCLWVGGHNGNLVAGQTYNLCFYAASLDPSQPLNTSLTTYFTVEIFNSVNFNFAIIGHPSDAQVNTSYSTTGKTQADYLAGTGNYLIPNTNMVVTTTTNDPNNIQWQQICVTYTATSNDESIYISKMGGDNYFALDNISFPSELGLTLMPSNCTDNGDGTFTANYDLIYDWTGAAAGDSIDLVVNGVSVGTIDPSTGSSPDTISISLDADAMGSDSIWACFVNEPVCSDTLIIKSPVACPTGVSACSSLSGCLGGQAFEDFNFDGIEDVTDLGIQGVQVIVYDCQNNPVDTIWTDSDGDWELCGLTDGDDYRVEYFLPENIACWAIPTHSGTDNGTDVQFLTAPACSNFSLSNPSDYCQENPNVYISCFVNGESGAGGTADDGDSFVSFPYESNGQSGSGGYSGTPNHLASFDTTGATWGIAYDRIGKRVFTSAVYRRHSGFGPLGPGGIYVLDESIASPFFAPYIDLSTLGINAGTNTRTPYNGLPLSSNELPANTNDPSWDSDAFDQVGRSSLGDIEVSDDGQTLYIVNVENKSIVALDISGVTPTLISETIVSPPIGCPASDFFIWGLTIEKGELYIGGVCSAESTGNLANLKGYLLKQTTSTFQLMATIPFDYARRDNVTGNGGGNSNWRPWTTTYQTQGNSPFSIWPQPIISDIEFEADGSIILGILDRNGLQIGSQNYGPDSTSTSISQGISCGDILKICGGVLEENGTCGGISTLGANDKDGYSDGVNNGEFYWGDQYDYHAWTNPVTSFATHTEIGFGSLLLLKGLEETMMTCFDPTQTVNSGGVIILNNNTGGRNSYYSSASSASDYGYRLYIESLGSPSSFGKSNGLGDIEAGCDLAPLEIGNLVWFDSIQNGIQDACELGVANMIVQLYTKTGLLIGQDTTSAIGNYYFNQYNTDTTGITVDGAGIASPVTAWTGINYGIDYFLVYGDGQYDSSTDEFLIGADTYTGITTLDVNSDGNNNIDSDIDGSTLTTAIGSIPSDLPFVCITTGDQGGADHKYDLGIIFSSCELRLILAQTSCSDNGDGTFTANYDLIYEWTGAPAGDSIEIVVNGVVISTVDPSISVSPDTVSISLDADAIGSDSIWANFVNETTCADTIIFTSPVACPTDMPTCSNASGCLGGKVFEDFNYNGSDDSEPGIQGIKVIIYDDQNTAVDSIWADSDGDWEICGLTDGVDYRIEFSVPQNIGCWASPTPAGNGSGTENGSDVQFVTAPACADFSLSSPGSFCDTSAMIMTPCYFNGDPMKGGTAANEPAFVGFKYNRAPYGPTSSQVGDVDSGSGKNIENIGSAVGVEVGSVWGTAYSKKRNTIYTSAFLKRHMGFGPLGIGGVYQIIDPFTTSETVASWVDLAAAPHNLNFGADPRSTVNDLPADKGPTPSHDVDAYLQIGHVSMGDMDISDDEQHLWIMNVYDKQVIKFDIDNQTIVSTYNLPDPGCSNGEYTAWALEYHKGIVYAGINCTGLTSQDSLDLHAYIYSLDDCATGGTFQQLFDFDLNYERGFVYDDGSGDTEGAFWNEWINDTLDYKYLFPQPIFSDIEVDKNGSIAVGIMDRNGHQTGTENYKPDRTSSTTPSGSSGGDILRICPDLLGQLQLENNGSCGGITVTYAKPTYWYSGMSLPTNQSYLGPGGGEYYNADYNASIGLTIGHEETGNGGLAIFYEEDVLLANHTNPFDGWAGGVKYYNNSTGNVDRAFEIFDYLNSAEAANLGAGKTNGLGDMELLCPMAPLEVGNYVWHDANQNGIQDAGESGIENMIVQLYSKAGILIGQDTTSSTGNYYFNQANVDTTGITVDGAGAATPVTGWTGLNYNVDYFIVFGDGQYNSSTGEFTLGADTYNGITTADVNSDGNNNIDSDIDGSTLTTAIGALPADLPFVCITTGELGETDHRYDFGLFSSQCDLTLVLSTTSCIDNGDGTFTANYDLIYEWTGAPAGDSIEIVVNGVVISTVDPSISVSPDTVSISLDADAIGKDSIWANFINETTCADTIIMKSPVACPTDMPACANAAGCIGGQAFEDFNCDGTEGTAEPGVQGVQVIVYDCQNNPVDTVWTDSDGDWELCGLTDGDDYRIEYILPENIACWANPTHSGADNGTDIQFLTAPACSNFSLSNPSDYCQEDPDLATTCYTNGDYSFGGAAYDPGYYKTVVRFPYSSTGTTPGPIGLADGIETGTVYGIAWNKEKQELYTSSFVKRHCGLPTTVEMGRIYVTTDPTGTPATSTFIDLIALGEDVGQGLMPASRTLARYTGDPSADSIVFHLVGKVGFGDIELSEDDKTLYAMNLHRKEVVVIDVASQTILTKIPVPDLNCNDGETRPFALKYRKGTLYAGAVCSAENGGASSDLTAAVFKYNGSSFNKITEVPIDYNRSHFNGALVVSDWLPWTNTWQTISPGIDIAYPQAILSDIEIDIDGSLILGFMDRIGHQTGVSNFDLDGTGAYSGVIAGDIVRICNIGGNYIMEGVGGCSYNLTPLPNGPGGEYYFGEDFGPHHEIANGGLVHLMGSGEITSTAYDLFDYTTGGVIWLDNTGGDDNKRYEVYGNSVPGNFGKAAGLGDLEAFCNLAPLEIGNLVWADIDMDGIQDACEDGISDVLVQLYDENGVLIGQDTTVNGNYYFNQNNVDTTGITVDGTGQATAVTAWSGMQFNTKYYVVYGNGQYDSSIGEFAVGAVDYLGMTIVDVNSDSLDKIDSDVDGNTLSTALGSMPADLPFVCITTDSIGCGNHKYDVGLIPPIIKASIGNYVWIDEDGNGLQDAGEPGIANVVLELCDATSTVIDTIVTDANGGYLFTDLDPDTYTVKVRASTLPNGVTQTTNPTNANSDFGNQTAPYSVTVGPGEENLTADFGYNWGDDTGTTNLGALGDRVWIDTNADGIQDAGEIGIAGVTLTLCTDTNNDGVIDTNDSPYTAAVDATGGTGTGTTTTATDGSYIFHSLPAGAYAVKVDASNFLPGGALDGYTQTGDPDHFMDASGNAPAGTAGDNMSTIPILLAPGDVFLNVDFGYDNPTLYEIGDQIYFDTDADGTEGATEPGIAGVTVTLTDAACNPIATTTTDANGYYLFTGVPDGAYKVIVTDTDNVLDGLDNSGDPDGGTPNQSAVTISGASDLDQDFGYTPEGHSPGDGLIGDYVWLDANGDGIQDPTESGIESVIVELCNAGPDGVIGGGDDELVASTLTNENGFYAFGGLSVNDGDGNEEYYVKVPAANFTTDEVLENYSNTYDSDTDNDNEGGLVTLSPGTPADLDQDFGYQATTPFSISNQVFADTDADGVFEPSNGETGIPGVTLCLYADLDGDGLVDPDEPKIGNTTTDAAGTYIFDGLPDGDYVVVVSDAADELVGCWLSEGATDTNDNSQVDPYATTIAGANIETADFGYYKKPACLGNYVWEDTNVNGIQDASEAPVSGVEITLTITYPSGVVVSLTDTSDATGHYDFCNLLLDEDHNGIGTFATDSTGGGDEPYYKLTVTNGTTGYIPTLIDVSMNASDMEDSDDGVNGVQGLAIQGETDVANQTDPTTETTPASYDFGFVLYVEPATIGNYVWIDEDGNGLQDAGEPGIANVVLELCDTSSTVIDTIVTDANGGYLFTDLDPGTYTVKVRASTLPNGVTQTTNPTNANGDFGNQTAPYSVTVGPGEENLTADFGYNWGDDTGATNLGALGDRVWIDTNADGIQDAGEIGISGVTLTLCTDTNNDGVIDTNDSPYTAAVDATGGTGTGTTTTATDGSYIFHSLPAGAYAVKVDASNFLPGGALDGYTQTGDPDHFMDASGNAPAGTAGDNMSTIPIILAPGDVFLNVDFGYDNPTLYEIGDQIYFDIDADGTEGATEPGIPGVTVTLTDAACNPIATTTTDANGNYLFTGVPDGMYKVIVTDTDNVLDGLNNSGDPDGGTPNLSTVTIAGASDLDQDFGYTPEGHSPGDGLIGDYVWLDANGDGVQDPTESGIESVIVELCNAGPDGVIGGGDDELVASTLTNENGFYAFGGLSVDDGDGNEEYYVKVPAANFNTNEVLENYSNTFDSDTDNDNEGGLVTLSPGTPADLDQDFGYQATTPFSISNQVFADTDADGVFEPSNGEAGIPGVTLCLYADLDGDGLVGPDEPKIGNTTTDAAGTYIFDGLPDGDYVVVVSDAADELVGCWLSEGATDTNDNSQVDAYATTIAGANIETADFGYYKKPACVGNYVWEDADGDGIQDAAEAPVSGIEITLTITYPSGVIVTLTDTTDATGHYDFCNLLLDEDHNGIGTFATDGAGGGDEPYYKLTVTNGTTGFIPTVKDVSSNGSDLEDSDDCVNGVQGLAIQGETDVANQTDPTTETNPASYDFGFVIPASLGNCLWIDTDNDGIQDAGENGLNGVTITLIGAGPDGVFGNGDDVSYTTTTMTDPNNPAKDGYYLIDSLPPGDYMVSVTAPSGYTFTTSNATVDTLDSDVDTSGMSGVYTLVGGQTDPTVDIGIIDDVFPLELISFSAIEESCEVVLNWVTAYEEEIDHFVVERSTNGRDFYPIGNVAAVGNSTWTTTYSFTDPGRESRSYYRLKVVETTGVIEYYAKVIFVQSSCWSSELGVTVYPNPVEYSLNIALNKATDETEDILLEIVDPLGRILIGQVARMDGSSQVFSVQTDKLAAGVYFIKVRAANNSWETKAIEFVKLK